MQKKLSANFVIIIPCIIVLFNLFLVLNPTEMIAAAREGLLLWFNQVLPSLLPFVVGINVLTGLGFISFLGVLASPVMLPLFKVPGAGAFAFLTGLTSGYPMGAKAVAHLRETGQIRQEEAQRLLAFSNNAGPLFVIGFVGVGLFGSARIGYMLLISHITAAIIIGVGLRLLSKTDEAPTTTEGGISQAMRSFQNFRREEYEGFGSVLGASIKNAMEAMLTIGGFIIVFSVVIKSFELSNIFGGFIGLVAGVLEVANGARILTQRGGADNPASIVLTSMTISFGGLSVLGQTAHFLRDTDVKLLPYLRAKILQALVAGGICLILLCAMP